MNSIYLVSSDGYRESINLEKYATTEDEIIKLVLEDFKEWNFDVVIISTILKDDTVQIEYYEDWDVEKKYKDTKTYYVHKVNKYA